MKFVELEPSILTLALQGLEREKQQIEAHIDRVRRLLGTMEQNRTRVLGVASKARRRKPADRSRPANHVRDRKSGGAALRIVSIPGRPGSDAADTNRATMAAPKAGKPGRKKLAAGAVPTIEPGAVVESSQNTE